ncbi:MAG: protein-disulfide reductase DsbD domain-containing protein [Flavobacteriales bacterium]
MNRLNFRTVSLISLIAGLSILGGVKSTFAQILDPVKWAFSVHETTVPGEFDVVFHASVEPCWHIYSQFLDDPNGPLPTYFEVNASEGVELIENVVECDPIIEYDPNFMMDLKFFEEEVYWVQRVKTAEKTSGTLSGFLSFMVCDASRCLPPEDIDFSIDLSKVEPALETYCPPLQHLCDGHGLLEPVKRDVQVYEIANQSDAFELIYHASVDNGWHLYSQHIEGFDGPMPTEFRVNWPKGIKPEGQTEECEPITKVDPNFNMEVKMFEDEVYFVQRFNGTAPPDSLITGAITFMTCDDTKCIFPPDLEFTASLESPLPASERPELCPAQEHASSSAPQEEGLLGVFLLGMLLGFAAILTPCVFPMIPMTVSFFTKQSKTEREGIINALIYGFFIIFIYTGLGLLLTAFFGVDILNVISTDPYFNLFLFALLIVFGVSFLGAFDIQLPSSWANKTDQAADRGGLIGIFFMAATLAIVSFSCTGPLVGSALAGAATGSYAAPIAVMFGFSLALALPFMLFSAFPGWLNSLPQSGGWLNNVKVVLGLLEIGFAFKFLSNTDMVWQLGLLKRELFIGIWILTSLITAAYLFGWIRFWHDSAMQRIGGVRVALGALFVLFSAYMIPGLWGKDVPLISGFPPGMDYSFIEIDHVKAEFFDYDEGMAAAKERGVPLLLDFTGWACVNCRKMEEQVWPDSTVSKIHNEDVVLVSLYVDERIDLPKEEQREESYGGKTFKIKTIGNKWSYLQASEFDTNSQPFYVMLDHEGNDLRPGVGYDPDPEKFIEFLRLSIATFEAN